MGTPHAYRLPAVLAFCEEALRSAGDWYDAQLEERLLAAFDELGGARVLPDYSCVHCHTSAHTSPSLPATGPRGSGKPDRLSGVERYSDSGAGSPVHIRDSPTRRPSLWQATIGAG